MSLPTYTGRRYFSASISNEYTRSLLASYAWAIAPRAPFSGLLAAATGTGIWTGFVLYTGDTTTFRYRLNHSTSGTSTIKVDAVTVATPTGTGVLTGTATLSGLTAGEVYSVTLDSGVTCDPQWLGLSKTISYTTPPTFVNGNALTAANWTTLRSGLAELETARGMPHTPNILGRKGSTGPRKGVNLDGSEITVWRGFFYHVHDTLRYRFQHGIDDKTVNTLVYYNGSPVVTQADPSHDITRSGTASAAGTPGTHYECKVTFYRSGTSATVRGFCHLYELSQSSSASVTPPPVWAHGDQTISAANMNRYSTIINTIHPGAGGPTAPLYYEQPALKTDTTGYRYYIQHRRKWLRYRVRQDVSGKTVEIYYGPNMSNRHALPSTAGNQSFDMTTLPGGISLGQFYLVEDVEFACEYDTQQV